MQFSPGRSVKRPQLCTETFSSKLTARIASQPLSHLLAVEVFSGTGGLTASVRKIGMSQSLGVDAHVSKQVKAPIIRLNLADNNGQALLWKILENPRLVYIHLGPPCGTSSRAREIRRFNGKCPLPLRSTEHPNGLPHLRGVDKRKVDTANVLYALTGAIMKHATDLGILATIENPLRSHMWRTSFLTRPLCDLSLFPVQFHHCMYGATRRKRTKLLCNHECFRSLELECDNNHVHDAWGVTPTGSWATAAEVEYPFQLCQAWAASLKRCLLQHGALEPLQELTTGSTISLVQASKAATGMQPRGKKLQPLMREYSHFITVQGPKASLTSLPIKCSNDTPVPSGCKTRPMCPAIPQHAKRIKPPYQVGEKAELDQWEVVFGVSWTPKAFIHRASGRSHPGHFLDGVHPVLKEMFANGSQQTTRTRAQCRTEQMRRWVIRAKELSDSCEDGKQDAPEHAQKILTKKNLRLFQEMVSSSGSPDVNIAADIAKGFNLMGEIPSGSIYPEKYMHATLLPDQVREMAGLSRAAIWESAKRVVDRDISSEVYKITMEERDKGWLRGPFELGDLPDKAILTRRFGVKQSTTLSDGSRTMKVRPIDDYSESLVNATNSCGEAIQPMSVDAILATLVHRDRMWGRDRLVGKTIDLRKAYKNLPISLDSLNDASLCVCSPEDGKPRAFQTLVLPFGARSAVMGFCRTSYALWRIGVVLFQMHWTVFFDDYYLVASEDEAKHVDMAQELIFRLLGWETSSEKEAGFRALAKILGVQVDLSDSMLGRFSVSNVESRVNEMVATIDAVLGRGTLSAAEMRILRRGRLVFAEAQILGGSRDYTCKI